MTTIQTILNYGLPILGGITVGGILTAIASIVFRSLVNKTLNKLNVEKVEENAVEKGIEKIKKISFSHSIQPLVESELQKVNEKSIEFLLPKLEELDKKYNLIIDCFDKFYKYFDNAVGVEEKKKEELKEAIETAKMGFVEPKEIVSTICIEENEKAVESPILVSNENIEVER